MVNEAFVTNMQKEVQRNLRGQLAGAPVVHHGGFQADHYKGIAHGLATALIPFFPSKYEASEYLFGYLPLAGAVAPQLFFQIPALNIKGRNIPGVGQFAAIVKGAVPETLVVPKVKTKPTFMPLKAMADRGGDVRMAALAKGQWPPTVQALNNDKKARKAAWPKKVDSYVSSFYVRMNKRSPFGFTQLAPFRLHTIITAQRVPAPTGFDNRPYYDYKRILAGFTTLAAAVAQHSTPGQSVGQQVMMQANQSMMELVLRQAETTAHTG